MKEDVVIVAAKRSPMGAMLGQLSSLPAPELAKAVITDLMTHTKIENDAVDEVILGCVLQAGIGQAPARQAALYAGLSERVGATTLNKMCGSGMKAIMLAHDLLLAHSADILIAGGMESMSQAPYLLNKARTGYRLGHGELKDHMFLDGLEDVYDKGKLMGVFAEQCAQTYSFSRQAQDEFAAASMTKALNAIKSGLFSTEITPITVNTGKETYTVTQDEGPNPAKLEKIAKLKPAFQTDGTVTAANSSSISDGAAALIMMREEEARHRGLQPIARIKAHASFANTPAWFTTAPIEAIKNVLDKAQWRLADVDLFEINEAFAVVAMAAIHSLSLDPKQVNVNGGACALGHPIGASGARIVVTLLHALKQRGLNRGVASLCIGGGEATALAVEICS